MIVQCGLEVEINPLLLEPLVITKEVQKEFDYIDDLLNSYS